MQLPINHFKRALRERRAQIGLWLSAGSPYVTEAVAGSGFDWLLIDTEHSPNDLLQVVSHLQCISAGAQGLAHPPQGIVRPAWNDTVLIKRYLDAGAQTLLIPMVQNAEEARAAVRAMRYPPDGVRGLGGTTRATRFGRVKDYFRVAAEQLCLLVQIETREGLANLEQIAAVDGVDGVFIGPADLSADLGFPGEMSHPTVQAAIDDAFARILACGKAPGIIWGDERLVQHALDIGGLFVAVGQDLVTIARQADALAAKYKR